MLIHLFILCEFMNKKKDGKASLIRKDTNIKKAILVNNTDRVI